MLFVSHRYYRWRMRIPKYRTSHIELALNTIFCITTLLQYLSEETASRSERNAIHLRQVMKEFQLFEGDTGSSEVQIALLTHKIALLAEHLQDHKKDHSSRRGLYAMLNQRRKLLQYLRRTKFDSYAQLITKIGLKDSFAPQTKFTQRYATSEHRKESSR